MTAELKTERRAATLVLTLSDPASRNALAPSISSAAIEALNVAESDPEVRCVVLTGDGGHFSSGGNLNRLASNRRADPQVQSQHIELFHQFIEAIRTHPKPVIAAVEGSAAGGGFSLALACDLVVAAEDARFSMAYGRVALSPDGGGSWHLAQALPRSLALQIIMLGDAVSARRLEAFGLVNQVTDAGQALNEALRMAGRLAGCAPNALASAKELVDRARGQTLSTHLGDERNHFVQNLFHANAEEGLQAFFEKRAPQFR
ncbi:MAG TPA: enoyl-CoA hydratase [Burkholderiaceae bacterium]|jgi:enoyl-CoA hydratase/carnithine racemase|nr:enoyl-CoA hydratase [Burkholderiaceae bacterium]